MKGGQRCGRIGTEGDNAVAGVRKRLLEGGHHANAEGEAQGVYDEGYVVVTKAAIPIGTRVTVIAGGRTLSRDIAAGDSYASTHDPRAHFGLGKADVAEELLVRWPDGTRTVRKNVRARQFLTIRKGES